MRHTGAVVLTLALVAVACSSDPPATPPDTSASSSSSSSSSSGTASSSSSSSSSGADASSSSSTSSSSTSSSTGGPVDACVPPPLSGADPKGSCYAVGPCPTCADGVLYRCTTGGQPTIVGNASPAGCRRLSAGAPGVPSEHCCPASCVAWSPGTVEPKCEFANRPVNYSCPLTADGKLGAPKPAGPSVDCDNGKVVDQGGKRFMLVCCNSG